MSGRPGDDAPRLVRMPADVDREDQVLAGFTARQVLILTATAVLAWLMWTALRPFAGQFAVAGAVPIAAAGIVVALGSLDGLSLDRFAITAIRHARAGKLLVTAPSGTSRAPDWLDPRLARAARPMPAPLRLPARAIGKEGVIDLGADGWSVVLHASTVNFALRSVGEQESLVAGLARWLNGLGCPVQILARAVPLDLTAAVTALESRATGLPDAGLETAALDHAAFLAELNRDGELLARQVLVILREPAPGRTGAARVRQRAADTAHLLAAAGITATILDGPDVAALLNEMTGGFR